MGSDQRDAEPIDVAPGQHCGGALRLRLHGELATVDLRTRQGGEQEARPGLAAVGGDPGDLGVSV